MASLLSTASVAASPGRWKRHRPAWLPAAGALFFALLTAWLGQWQLGRAEEKRARQAALDAAARMPVVDLARHGRVGPNLYYRRVRATGRLDSAYQIYLDNRPYRGRAGYHVVSPLVIGKTTVLVNRGWLPAAADRSILPVVPSPRASLTVEGILVPARSRYLELSGQGVEGRVWQNLDLERYRAWYGASLPDALILQTSPADDGLIRDWPRPDAGVERHIGYAVQWFALTAAIVMLYVYHGLRRRLRAPH